MKRIFPGILFVILFLYLLCCSSRGLAACSHALVLWSGSVVPSLLPVMILSRMLISSPFLFYLLTPFSFVCKKILGLSPSGTYAFFLGYLCGYPMGVKTVCDLQQESLLSKHEGYFLTGFINQVSPGFVITYVCSTLLHDPSLGLPFLLILHSASLTFGLLTARHDHTHYGRSADDIFIQEKKTSHRSFALLLDLSIEESVLQILKIGGYILIFSVLSSLICTLLSFSEILSALLTSLLEITCGTNLIAQLTYSVFLKKFLLIGALAFGGLCSIFQSGYYLHLTGCSFHRYIKNKAMITVIALIYYLLYSSFTWIPL